MGAREPQAGGEGCLLHLFLLFLGAHNVQLLQLLVSPPRKTRVWGGGPGVGATGGPPRAVKDRPYRRMPLNNGTSLPR